MRNREETANLLIESRIKGYEHIAKAWADWELVVANRRSEGARRRPYAAPKAAEAVRAKGKEVAEARRQQKIAEYTVLLYEHHFPWLWDLRDVDAELDYAASSAADPDDKNDPVSRLLSPAEYASLSTAAERNQRALDRYLRPRLTPWQLGRDYER